MPVIIPIRDLKDTAKISQMCSESDEPIYITKNGYGDMVVMSMKTYEEKLLLQDVYTKLEEAEADVSNGDVLDVKTVLNRVKGASK